MNLLPELNLALNDLLDAFAGRFGGAETPRSNEAYVRVPADLVAACCAHLYRKWDARLVSLFADDVRAAGEGFALYYVFALDAAHGFIVLRASVAADKPEFNSLTDAVHAVNWQEREIQDLFGIKLLGHPNPRRCALHDDWPDVHPLRKDFDLRTVLPPASRARGTGSARWRGRASSRCPSAPCTRASSSPAIFSSAWRASPSSTCSCGCSTRTRARRSCSRALPVAHGVRLAESISGDSGFAHATAFCHAVERAAGVEAPPRARALRTVCLELERLYNHIGDMGAICTDVAFVTANMHAMRLKEAVLRANEQLTGSRLLRGMACLGGVRFDLDPRRQGAIDRAPGLAPAGI